jgi:DNA polymerase III subunit delta'
MSTAHPAFSHILGQGPAVSFLSAAMLSDRLPHGLVFSGAMGVGRYTTAMALASVFLAPQPSEPESIDKTARLLAARSHPDFHFVAKEQVRELEGKSANKATEFSVDLIRERVVVPAGKKSFTGHGKVFIIEEAELMNAAAQNSLLKTLEEPSGRTLIVLLTESAGALLSTIRSRTQLVRFQSLTPADAQTVLQKRGVESALAKSSVELADGSPGQAIRWIEDGVVAGAMELGRLLDGSGDLALWFKSAADAYAKRLLERDPAGSEDSFRRLGITTYLRIACDQFRKQLREDISDAERERLCEKIDAAREAEALVDGNVNVQLVLQQIGMKLKA